MPPIYDVRYIVVENTNVDQYGRTIPSPSFLAYIWVLVGKTLQSFARIFSGGHSLPTWTKE